MYLRMLKKDLRDKVGLNIVLCIFMIIAATLLVTSAGFIYTFFVGTNETYEKCKTADIMFTVNKSISDTEGQREKINRALKKYPEIGEVKVSERPVILTERLEFEGVDRRTVTNLYEDSAYLTTVSKDQNIPYDMNDEVLKVENGCVAIPQYLANNAKTKIGSKIRVTTDMGNTYEFTVSHIYKDPSSNFFHKIVFSDEDYTELVKEFNSLSDLYEVRLKKGFSSMSELQRWGYDLMVDINKLNDTNKLDGHIDHIITGKSNMNSNAAMITFIISIFMVIMGVSLIILIFMSIRFSLHATIKREEKEIGTMKAIGVDSLAYKSLFIVKYIAFAVLSGVLGIVFGIPLIRFMINHFIVNTLTPRTGVFIVLGILMSISFTLLMIIFSFFALRRMRKISVMDTIHGENRGERFKKLPGVFLHKSRHSSVPFFLAAQDIIGRLKRYIYLIVSFTLGVTMLFLVVQLKETVVSDNFRKNYWLIVDREVFIRPEDNLRDKLVAQEGSYRNVFEYYEKYYNENGIPLNIQIIDSQEATWKAPGEDVGIKLYFDNADVELERLRFVKGGKVPTLKNEVAVSHSLKETKGLNLGDTVTLVYRVYQDDGFTLKYVKKDFIVTAYYESMLNGGSPEFIMAEPDENYFVDDWDLFNEAIDVPDDEYDATIEKMRNVNKDIMIWDFDQVLEYDLGREYGTIFDMLFAVIAIIMSVTIFAMTFLYQQIFIEEETADIAMLKSIGVDRSSIRGWHYLRMLILVVCAIILGFILSFTVSKAVFNQVGMVVLGVGKFTLASPTALFMVVIPLGLLMLVSISLVLAFKPIDSIKIWRVRDE